MNDVAELANAKSVPPPLPPPRPAPAPVAAQQPTPPAPAPPQVVYVAAPPVQPKVGSILFGVLLIGAALWLLLKWVPAHKPWSEDDLRRLISDVAFKAKVERLNEWRLKPTPYLLANGLSILIGLWGVSRVVHGASHRPRQG